MMSVFVFSLFELNVSPDFCASVWDFEECSPELVLSSCVEVVSLLCFVRASFAFPPGRVAGFPPRTIFEVFLLRFVIASAEFCERSPGPWR